jgi:hypothetical protein
MDATKGKADADAFVEDSPRDMDLTAQHIWQDGLGKQGTTLAAHISTQEAEGRQQKSCLLRRA